MAKYITRQGLYGGTFATIKGRVYADAGQSQKKFAVDYFKKYIKHWYIRLEYLKPNLYQVWLGGTRQPSEQS